MDGIRSLHEILQDTTAKKENGLVLKLDFEKAYDKNKLDLPKKVL